MLNNTMVFAGRLMIGLMILSAMVGGLSCEGAPKPSLEKEGERIAKQLGNGVIYNGPQMHKGKFHSHFFTDVAVTGTTFACLNLEDCKQRLIKKREEFGAEPPIFAQSFTKSPP